MWIEDKRTQQAVIMSIVIVGGATTKIMEIAEFSQAHMQVSWRSMCKRRGHRYFDINLKVVSEMLQMVLPGLLKQLPAVL